MSVDHLCQHYSLTKDVIQDVSWPVDGMPSIRELHNVRDLFPTEGTVFMFHFLIKSLCPTLLKNKGDREVLQGHLDTFYSVKREIVLPPAGPPRHPGGAVWHTRD